jgi:hypothetical protein
MGWRVAALLPPILALISLVFVNIGEDPKGFVFTPLWSAAFALWLLLAVTLVLHWLVRSQLEPQAPSDQSAAGEPAATEIDRRRQVAERVAEEWRAKDEEPAEQLEVQLAGRQVVDAAKSEVVAQVRARRMGLKSLVVGADGRASTSKLQAVLWTYAVLFAFSYMLVLGRVPYDTSERPDVGLNEAFTDFVEADLQPEYIALLGLPVAAAVAAKALTTGKIAQNQMSKPLSDKSGVGAGLAEIVSNDEGQGDLLDFQYFAFNVLALVYFFVAFATTSADSPVEGLPDIPPTLLTLAGVSTTSYVVKKALESGVAPTITSVAPIRVQLGRDTKLVISGSGFLTGRGTDAARRSGVAATTTATQLNQVLLDGRQLIVGDGEWSDTKVTATLPAAPQTREQLEANGWRDKEEAPVVVRDDVGVSSPAVTVQIDLPSAEAAPANGEVVEEPVEPAAVRGEAAEEPRESAAVDEASREDDGRS